MSKEIVGRREMVQHRRISPLEIVAPQHPAGGEAVRRISADKRLLEVRSTLSELVQSGNPREQEQKKNGKIKIIYSLDCALDSRLHDPDDSLALLYYLLHPDQYEISAILTSFGNTKESAVYKSVKQVLHLVGREDIPTVRGAKEKGDTVTDAKTFLDAIEKPGEYTLVSTGPLTNFAACDSSRLAEFKNLHMMGGAFKVAGNDFPKFNSELNIRLDPQAADTVLKTRNVNIVPLDATKTIHLPVEPIDVISEKWSWFGKKIRTWHKSNKLRGRKGQIPHDLIAAISVGHPELFSAIIDQGVHITRTGKTRLESKEGINKHTIYYLDDTERFYEFLGREFLQPLKEFVPNSEKRTNTLIPVALTPVARPEKRKLKTANTLVEMVGDKEETVQQFTSAGYNVKALLYEQEVGDNLKELSKGLHMIGFQEFPTPDAFEEMHHISLDQWVQQYLPGWKIYYVHDDKHIHPLHTLAIAVNMNTDGPIDQTIDPRVYATFIPEGDSRPSPSRFTNASAAMSVTVTLKNGRTVALTNSHADLRARAKKRAGQVEAAFYHSAQLPADVKKVVMDANQFNLESKRKINEIVEIYGYYDVLPWEKEAKNPVRKVWRRYRRQIGVRPHVPTARLTQSPAPDNILARIMYPLIAKVTSLPISIDGCYSTVPTDNVKVYDRKGSDHFLYSATVNV